MIDFFSFFIGFVVGYVIATVAACVIWARAIKRHNEQVTSAK